MAAPAAEVIPVVDLRLLSQAEISSLSLSCPNAFDLRRCDDVVVPKIDRSVFNESAGSRKQTYSRLRLAPHKPDPAAPSTVASRRPRGLFSPPLSSSSSTSAAVPVDPSLTEPGDADADDPGLQENLQIVSYLRQLFAREEPSPQTLTLATPILAQGNPNGTDSSGPQEPGREALALVLVEDGDREVLNRKGEAVDLVALGQKVDPFAEELRRRTAGLTTEEQLLGFMNGLDGQWGSRRRRRRIVDASEFGDHLPRGWKLLLGLKRKEGEVWVYCRRYISTSGKHFLSCKEVSSYILALFGDPNALLPVSVENNVSTPRIDKLNTDYAAGLSVQNNLVKEKPNWSTVAPFSSAPADHEKQIILYNAENQHQLSCHQRSAKRRKLGKLIGEGVIVKDGKFECQFCHKTFSERHRYNGHIGAHVRYQGLTAEALPDESISRKLYNPSPLAAVPYELFSLAETMKESSTLKFADELHLVSTHLQCEREDHEIDHSCGVPETTKVPSISKFVDVPVNHCDVDHYNREEIAHASNVTGEQSNSCTNGVDAVALPATDVIHVKIAQNTTMTSADDQVDDYHSKPEEITEASNVKNIEACSFKNVEASNFKNDNASDFKNAKLDSVQVNDHDSDHNSEIVLDTATDVNCSPYLDVIAIAPIDVTNATCETVTEVVQFFPQSMPIDCKINDCELTGYKPEEIVETNNRMGIKTNGSVKTISASLINVDTVVLGSSNEIDISSSAAVSEVEKYAIEQKLDTDNDLVTLSGNCSSYVTGIGATDTFTSNIEENVLVEMDKSSRKTELASSHSFSNDDDVVESIIPMELNTNCINIPLVGGHTSGTERNRECTFDIDMKGSMLGNMDGTGVELDSCFNCSNAGNEQVDASETVQDNVGNSLEVDVTLNSPWVHSSDRIPIIDMIPDQQYEDDVSAVCHKEKLSGFDQLTLNAVESSEFVHLSGQDSISLHEAPIGFSYMAALDNEGCSSVQLGWDISLQNSTYELTSVCVWCNREFSHVATSAEEESDTLGFICPTCKAKISGHLSVLSNQPSG